jgi:hypothetical protein
MSIQGKLNQQAISMLPKSKQYIDSSNDYIANEFSQIAIRWICDSLTPLTQMSAAELQDFDNQLVDTFAFILE